MNDARAWTVKQLAAHWQCSSAHVYALIQQRRLGHLTIGSLIRVRQQDVDEYEARAFWPPNPPQPPVVVVHSPIAGIDCLSPGFLAGLASRRRKPKNG
jgi:excisionase family DNA binding protein